MSDQHQEWTYSHEQRRSSLHLLTGLLFTKLGEVFDDKDSECCLFLLCWDRFASKGPFTRTRADFQPGSAHYRRLFLYRVHMDPGWQATLPTRISRFQPWLYRCRSAALECVSADENKGQQHRSSNWHFYNPSLFCSSSDTRLNILSSRATIEKWIAHFLSERLNSPWLLILSQTTTD